MKKKTKVTIGCVAGVLVLGSLFSQNPQAQPQTLTTSAASETASVVQEPENILMKKIKTKNVTNGYGETIGEWACIEIRKSEMLELTQEQFQEFVDEVVKDSGYNYVTIIAEDASKAIFFPGSMVEIAQYGKVNINGMLDNVYGYITLQEDGSYLYEEK